MSRLTDLKDIKIEVLFGDCFDWMPRIPAGKISLILTDLPYGVTECRWDTPLNLKRLWMHFKRLLKPNGAVVMTASHGFNMVLGMSNRDWYRYSWVWFKSRGSNFFNVDKMPFIQTELVLVFYENQPTYNPQKIEREPSGMERAKYVHRHTERPPDALFPDKWSREGHERFVEDKVMRNPHNVLFFPKNKNKEILHPSQKPIGLFQYLVRTYTDEGDLVFDPCAGSGTTAMACKRENRRCITTELDKAYFDIATHRLRYNDEDEVIEHLIKMRRNDLPATTLMQFLGDVNNE